MMNIREVDKLLGLITYKPGWEVHAFCNNQGRVYIQVRCAVGIDSQTHEPTTWVSGKRYLSKWMTRQEVVGCVFDLIKTAELHEVHEFFRYKGASIYNPHLDPDKLVEVARKHSSFICRVDSMTKA